LTVELARRLFTVDEYHRMAEVGILTRRDRVELIDLNGGVVEVYREPSLDGYRVAHRLERGADLAPGAFPDIALSVDEILG